MHRFESLLKDAFASRTRNRIHTFNARGNVILVVKRKLTQKIVTVTVRALIGAFLSTGVGKAGLGW
jgi:hypothetical protein